MNRFAGNLNPYERFKGHPVYKTRLISALVSCIRDNIHKAFSCSVVLRDWEALNERYDVAESLGYPYSFCGRTCIAQVLKWAKKKKALVQFFFEDGATHQKQFKKIIKLNDDIEPIFRSKEAMVQFQASDLLAWKNRKL